MSVEKRPLPHEPQDSAANDGAAFELSDEAVSNLTGFFDILIQMDLTQKQRKEKRSDKIDN
jgi:hypothetical protein